MVIFTVYGQRHVLAGVRSALSDVLHDAAVELLGAPPHARCQRFIGLDNQDLPIPTGRTARHTFVEVRMMTGRTVTAKKTFYARLYADAAVLGIDPVDLEVAILETPAHDWAVRGLPGDELGLPAPAGTVQP